MILGRLYEHFLSKKYIFISNINKKLGKKGDLITTREYNVLGGMNVADVTEGTKMGDSLTLSALGGIYSLVDSFTQGEKQDFFSKEGGIGDFSRKNVTIF